MPNFNAINKSKDFPGYQEKYPEENPFSYSQNIKKEWLNVLNEDIVPLEKELR